MLSFCNLTRGRFSCQVSCQRDGSPVRFHVSIVGALGYTLNDLTSDRPVSETALAIPEDIARALSVCEEEERETILRIIREMTALIHRS